MFKMKIDWNRDLKSWIWRIVTPLVGSLCFFAFDLGSSGLMPDTWITFFFKGEREEKVCFCHFHPLRGTSLTYFVILSIEGVECEHI